MRPSVFKALDEYNRKQADFAAWCKRRQIATDGWITLSGRDAAKDTKELDSLRDSALASIKRREEYAIRRLTDAQLTLYIKQGDKLTPKQNRMFKTAFMQVRHNFHRAQNRILDETRSVRSDLNNEFVPF